jgi:hypothetical protein
MRRPDGRIVERVRVPVDLVDAVAREAVTRGIDFETCAGDLIAESLPDALREVAEALLVVSAVPEIGDGPTRRLPIAEQRAEPELSDADE